MAKFCPVCGNEIKGNSKFCSKCGKQIDDNKIVPSYASTSIKKKFNNNTKTVKLVIILVLILVGTSLIGNMLNKQTKETQEEKEEQLIGTWIVPSTSNQILEIGTEEVRFNSRRFEYKVEANKLMLKETFPSRYIRGSMEFELEGDTLQIDLGETFAGYFYGRRGSVTLKRED